MTVCIDANVLIEARSKSHPCHCILRGCVLGAMQWAVSSSILTEYREMVITLSDVAAWRRVEALLDAVEGAGDLLRVSPQFQFRLIGRDPDDNKLVDCAIAAHADYVITNDRHFDALANAGYKPQPITPERFIQLCRGIYV